jgi:uncharacterized membrane protein YhdT
MGGMPALLDRLIDRREARLPLMATGAIAAGWAAGIGLVVLTVLVLIAWIAAPHSGIGGLPGVFRAAALLWLVAHHVGLRLHDGGQFGMLPLGLVVLPGALLYRAGRWVVRSASITRLRHVAAAAAALAAPYAAVALILALVAHTPPASASVWQAVLCPFILAFGAGGLGGARALAPWGRLLGLLPDRPRSVAAGMLGALAVLGCAGAALAAGSLVAHYGTFGSVTGALAPGIVGGVLLLLLQVAYVPNAVVWAVAFLLGPGFAVGTGTVVAPSGSAVGSLPMFPLLAAMPAGGSTPGHPPGGMPGWLSVAVLATPYLAGAFAGLVVVRTAPNPSVGTAPLWGFASGAAAGIVIGVLAGFAGGPLGGGRLAAVGPSGWQAGLVATFGIGIAAAVSAGIANWLASGRGPLEDPPSASGPAGTGWEDEDAGDRHRIYVDPWADEPVP